MSKAEDLKPAGNLPSFWDTKDAIKNLDQLYESVTKKANCAIEWYYERKGRKSVVGAGLRYGAIVFLVIAGIIPVLVTILRDVHWIFHIDPAWSSVAIAIAGLMVAIDKFGGFTSAWIRYVLAAQELDEAVGSFQLEWEEEKASITLPMTNAKIQIMIAKCKDFLQRIQTIVHEETEKWAVEFQKALKDIDEASKIALETAKEKAKMEAFGAVSIVVTNGLVCDNGWKFGVDGPAIMQANGTRAAATNIRPGIVKIHAEGMIGGKPVQDTQPVKVAGGEIAAVTLNLQ